MENYYSLKACYCALNRQFGYSPRIGADLIRKAGGVAEVFRMPRSQLEKALVNLPSSVILDERILERSEKEIEDLEDKGFRFLCLEDRDYPEILKECPDPPFGLYISSTDEPSALFSRPAVAIVGTRNLTPYGSAWCKKIVEAMSRLPFRCTVISGLAFGADFKAHQTALETGLPTIGVMATGIDKIYPWQHQELSRKIVAAEGSALITDYPPETSPLAINFMRRNRIIAGLAKATVVIESASKGGSLITARYANEYNRDVYALPGRADDHWSSGCNSLIRDKMAEIITDPQELVKRIFDELPTAAAPKENLTERVFRQFSDEYSPDEMERMLLIIRTIRDNRGISAEELCSATALPYSTVASMTNRLEAAGYLRKDLFQRCSLVQ